MADQSKKHIKFYLLSLLGFYLAINLTSCQQQVEPEPLAAPVEIATGQKAKHTSFQAAIARFEAQLAQDVAEDSVGSISAGVLVGNDVVWSKGFGWANIEQQIPADEATIYRTGSISKSFTAVLMMQMIEKGVFKLDDPVENYFPTIKELRDKPENASPITFLHLASHTAGIIREPKLKGVASGPINQWVHPLASKEILN